MSDETPAACFKRLREEIINLSKSNNWKDAKNEWIVTNTSNIDDTDHCLCGHHIEYSYYIKNIHSNVEVVVGSTCIKRFKNKQMTDKIVELNKILCKPCGKILKDKQAYKQHIKTATHIKKVTCICCSKKFKNILTYFDGNYYCKNCMKKDIKYCITCKEPFGKISDIQGWKHRCLDCHRNFKYKSDNDNLDYFLDSESSDT